MDPQLLQLEQTLGAYQARGCRALCALQADDWDGFESAMRWKKASFQHFRALDHILEKRYPGYLQTEHWKQVWTEIEALDRKLADEMERSKKRLHKKIHRVTHHRAALKKFQSGDVEKAGFCDTI